MNHLDRSYPVLPATDQPFHSPPTAPDAPLLSQLISTLIEVFPWIQEPLHYFTPRGTGPILLPVLFFFTSSFFHPTQFFRNLSCPFWYPRSSASVHSVGALWELLSLYMYMCICIYLYIYIHIHTYILDTFVETDDLQIFLLSCHLALSYAFISFRLSYSIVIGYNFSFFQL